MSFDHWMAEELPENSPPGPGSGEFDYWQVNELPAPYGPQAEGEQAFMDTQVRYW